MMSETTRLKHKVLLTSLEFMGAENSVVITCSIKAMTWIMLYIPNWHLPVLIFTPCSSISTVNFEYVIADWVQSFETKQDLRKREKTQTLT